MALQEKIMKTHRNVGYGSFLVYFKEENFIQVTLNSDSQIDFKKLQKKCISKHLNMYDIIYY